MDVCSLADFLSHQEPIINRPCSQWPPQDTKHETSYLGPNGQLTFQSSTDEATLAYQADAAVQQMDQDTDKLCFTHTFEQTCTLHGSARAVLCMSTNEHDDMDVHVQLRINIPKSDRGAVSMTEVEPINPMIYLGPTGALRASYRALDHELSTEHWPEHTFSRSEELQAGQVVKLEIGLWQTGIRFEAGEKLVLKVSGHPLALAEFPLLRGAIPNANTGKHVIHVGGERASHLVIPVVES